MATLTYWKSRACDALNIATKDRPGKGKRKKPVLDKKLSGAWEGPSSGCYLAGALSVPEPYIAVTGTGRPLFVESRFRCGQCALNDLL